MRIECCEVVDAYRWCKDIMFAGYGAMHATCGDLTGEGTHDIAIAVGTDFEVVNDCIVLWEKDGCHQGSKAAGISDSLPASPAHQTLNKCLFSLLFKFLLNK